MNNKKGHYFNEYSNSHESYENETYHNQNFNPYIDSYHCNKTNYNKTKTEHIYTSMDFSNSPTIENNSKKQVKNNKSKSYRLQKQTTVLEEIPEESNVENFGSSTSMYSCEAELVNAEMESIEYFSAVQSEHDCNTAIADSLKEPLYKSILPTDCDDTSTIVQSENFDMDRPRKNIKKVKYKVRKKQKSSIKREVQNIPIEKQIENAKIILDQNKYELKQMHQLKQILVEEKINEVFDKEYECHEIDNDILLQMEEPQRDRSEEADSQNPSHGSEEMMFLYAYQYDNSQLSPENEDLLFPSNESLLNNLLNKIERIQNEMLEFGKENILKYTEDDEDDSDEYEDDNESYYSIEESNESHEYKELPEYDDGVADMITFDPSKGTEYSYFNKDYVVSEGEKRSFWESMQEPTFHDYVSIDLHGNATKKKTWYQPFGKKLCKWFPRCNKKDKCKYLHPRVECYNFKYCKLRNCNYAHENQRIGK